MSITLTNFTIYQRQANTGQTYLAIYDQDDNSKSYYCFQNKLKNCWTEIVNNYHNWQEIELEYEETEKGRKVTSLFVVCEKGDIII
jgi:hypothetical protein